MIRQIRLQNLLSFGPDTPPLDLGPLNVLIGPNGSGKSNLIEAISLLQAAPRDLAAPVREGGGVEDWVWKGATETQKYAFLTVVVESPVGSMPLDHLLSFGATGQRFTLKGETIQGERAARVGEPEPKSYFVYKGEPPCATLWVDGLARQLPPDWVDSENSILSQRKDPQQYPEITHLSSLYERIRIYREWSFGRACTPRQPQRADQRNDYLAEDCGNLGLVLNRLRRDAVVKNALLTWLRELYEGIDDFDVIVEGGTVQVFFHEGRFEMPATRLSDGTLRYLCLLAILCDPSPPPLICIEEPELGLHPDVLPAMAKLLKEASERTQLIVTTHSDALVDEFTDTPDCVVVCEKVEGATQMRRLDAGALKDWLGEYSLGKLWRRGEVGGNRW